MSNMSPFEIRLELLKMAKEMLEQEFFVKFEHDKTTAFPSEAEVIAKAKTLNDFVSKA
jgi:hypothetical protein